MDYTKKIMYQSNSWYNDGLRKAQVRDMSGAIVSLQQSLQYNSENGAVMQQYLTGQMDRDAAADAIQAYWQAQ